VTAGDVVWAVLAAALVAMVVTSLVLGPSRMPGIAQVAGWFLRSWLGRILALAAWAGAGWHLFCQRP
jgi:hypothetical protein